MRKLCLVFWALLLVDGVFGVEKVDVTQSVMEGDSVILNPHSVIPEDDSAEWWFGDEIIAKINKADGLFSTSEGDKVGFKGRLNLDHQTGSLTITNITTDHDGLYKLQIMSTTQISKIFRVTVSDVVESVSVVEGVTLHTGVTGIQRELIQWKFGDQVLNFADARWSNTDLNHQTGDITIGNILRNQSGDYEVEIKNNNSLILHKKFRVITHEINIMSVEEGNDVTLQTDTKTQRDDQILWMYGPESIPIAEINKVSKFYEDVLDGRFRGRLKLDHQTGYLTITNTRTTDTGVYKLQISSREATKYTRFVVTVSVPDKQTPDPGLSSGAVGGIVGVLLVFVAVLAAVVIYYRRKNSELQRRLNVV